MVLSSVVSLYTVACVHPEVLQAMARSLLPTEADLVISSFGASDALQDVLEGHFCTIMSPSMREDSVRRNGAFWKLGQAG